MKHSNSTLTIQDRFGIKLAARLSSAADALPHDIGERLRAARMQALDKRKQVKIEMAAALQFNGGAATLHFGDEGSGWWRRVASVIPLLALAAGLVAIQMLDNDNRARELADIDSAILTDDLPPVAYTDPGFAQFLKAFQDEEQ